MSDTQNIDATEGSLVRKSLQIAWPAVLQAILVNFYAFNDFLFVGMLGDAAGTAALSACFAVLVVNYTLIRVISTGATTLISQAFGEQQRERLVGIVRRAIGSELVWSSVVGVGGLLLLPTIVGIANATPEVGSRIDAYLSIVYWSSPFFGLVMVVVGAFRACGNTRVPLLLELVSLGLNGLLNWLLVLGPGPFPSLGITGAAVATSVSRAFPGVAGLVLILRGHLGVDLWRRVDATWRRAAATVGRMFRIGAYQSASGLVYGSVYFVLNRMAGELGPAAQGGLGAGLRGIEWIGYAVGDGFTTATMAVVGQNLGAEKYERAARGARVNGLLSGAACQAIGLVFAAAPVALSRVVTDDPATVARAAEYVGTIGWVLGGVGVEMASYGALIGAGRTHVSLMVSGTLNLVRIPVTVILLFGVGGLGPGLVWAVSGAVEAPATVGDFSAVVWAIVGTAVVKAVILGVYVWWRLDAEGLAGEGEDRR